MLSVTLLTWVLEWKRKRCRYRQGSGSHTILLVYFNGTCASSVSACVHLRKQSVPSFTLCLQTAMHFSSAMKTWNSWDLHNSFQQNLKISEREVQVLNKILWCPRRQPAPTSQQMEPKAALPPVLWGSATPPREHYKNQQSLDTSLRSPLT